jgi:predicted O-methyltransferase YrrM
MVMGEVLMVKILNNFQNYLLNKSNRYNYYKSEAIRLKQEISSLEKVLNDSIVKSDKELSENRQLKQNIVYLKTALKDLNIKLNNEISNNIQLKQDIDVLTYEHPPGHYYSPINDIDFLKKRENNIWKPLVDGAIEFNGEEQLNLLNSFTKYFPEIPFKSTKQTDLRYYFENDLYEYLDGTILYSMIRSLQPKKIVEVGSGFTSSLMLDINEIYFDDAIELTFIDPYPERLYSFMSENDKNKNEVLVNIVQDVNLEKFQELNPNDILFIDSSHVVKTGSDVQYILFEILPRLKKGVYIHFHDIFYPFQYPKTWILEKQWNWNENFFLRAFLMYNNQFEIVLFPTYLNEHYHEQFENIIEKLPVKSENNKNEPYEYKKNVGASLWIKKI